MPILRHHHTKDFTIVPNALIQDSRLQFRDIGLLVYMLSLPDDWKFSVRGLVAISEEDNREKLSAINASIKRISAAGYIKMERQRVHGKISDVIWTVSDVPISPHLDFLDLENLNLENQSQTKNL